MSETCAICGCQLHRGGSQYAKPSVEGRSHATEHHLAADRFFGRSGDRPHEERERIFETDPWGVEHKTAVFCYKCHEELLHNPVLLPGDLEALRELVRRGGLNETEKPLERQKLAGRIVLLHDALHRGLQELLRDDGVGPN